MKIQIIVIVALLLVLAGCLSVEDQARMDELGKRIRDLQGATALVIEKVQTKELTLMEGELILRQYQAEIKRDWSELNALKDKGYEWYEILGGVLMSIIANVGVTRAWRGGINERKGMTTVENGK